MLRSAKSIFGHRIQATDGELGTVYGFLFDDQNWCIRYLVVKTGGWLNGRRVLVSPIAFGHPHSDTGSFTVSLTMDQVRNSPDIDADKPVSQQHREALHYHYGWMPYWTAPTLIFEPVPQMLTEPPFEVPPEAKEEGDSHLRSSREVIGYLVRSGTSAIGRVEDFILDDEYWYYRYLVIDLDRSLGSRKILIPPDWITAIDWADAAATIDVTPDRIVQSPAYDPKDPVNREYEARFYDYYGRPKYWEK